MMKNKCFSGFACARYARDAARPILLNWKPFFWLCRLAESGARPVEYSSGHVKG
jgi:hypothetical protein